MNAPDTPAANTVNWRALAWVFGPPIAVLMLRALWPEQGDAGGLHRIDGATLVSTPGEAFWMAARPLAYGLLSLAAVVTLLVVTLRRAGWARARPWFRAAWLLMWLATGGWIVASELNRAGLQPLPEQPAKVLLAREIGPSKRSAGGTEVYFEIADEPTPLRLLVEGQPPSAFVPGSTARLQAESGRWWGRWGRLDSRLAPAPPVPPRVTGRTPGG